MRRMPVLSLAPFLALLVSPSTVFPSDAMFMTATGSKLGDIKGGVTRNGLDGSMEVLQFLQEIISPRDPATGQATGKRQHQPLHVRLTVDKATPLLIQAMVTNENLTKVEISFYRRTPSTRGAATLTKVLTVTLTNANIASVALSNPDETNSATQRAGAVLELTFVYQKIEWTWVDGGVTAADDWEATG